MKKRIIIVLGILIAAEMVAAKYAVLLLLSILFCISSTAASILCGSICFDVTNIIYKLPFMEGQMRCKDFSRRSVVTA